MFQVAIDRNNEISIGGAIDRSCQETMNSQREQVFCLPTIMTSPSHWSSDSGGKVESGAHGEGESKEVSLGYIRGMDGDGGNIHDYGQLITGPLVMSSTATSNGASSLEFDKGVPSDRNRPNELVGIRNKRHLDIVEEVRIVVEVLY